MKKEDIAEVKNKEHFTFKIFNSYVDSFPENCGGDFWDKRWLSGVIVQYLYSMDFLMESKLVSSEGHY